MFLNQHITQPRSFRFNKISERYQAGRIPAQSIKQTNSSWAGGLPTVSSLTGWKIVLQEAVTELCVKFYFFKDLQNNSILNF